MPMRLEPGATGVFLQLDLQLFGSVCLQPPFKEKATDNLHRASKHIFGFS